MRKIVYCLYAMERNGLFGLGPVVQSTVSLTNSFVKDSLSLLAHIKAGALLVLLKNLRRAWALQKPSHFLSVTNGSNFAYATFGRH